MQQIALAHKRRYGYRRITAELKRQGRVVNHKRVARIMAEDHLLALGRRKFIVTTDSHHELRVYWNLAARLELSGLNQLWIADITYIRLGQEFVFLAVVLDAFSRRVVGWAVDQTLETRLPLAALAMAIALRHPAPEHCLVHHSDQGVQYASNQYVALLNQHGITPSMSRAGNPYDNARCESFMKTLKQEETYANVYCDRADLEAHIGEFIEQYYNRPRPHSALGYLPPEESPLSIPWRVALQQRPPPLSQPYSCCHPDPRSVEQNSANGNRTLSYLPQPKGSPQRATCQEMRSCRFFAEGVQSKLFQPVAGKLK